MQDWSYTAGDPMDIEKYISHYNAANDDDKKFVLMEFLIQAIVDLKSLKLFLSYIERVKAILEINFTLHEYTIHYWACFNNQNKMDCWKITPLMRELWFKNNRI